MRIRYSSDQFVFCAVIGLATLLLMGPCPWAYKHLPWWVGVPALILPLALQWGAVVWVAVRARRRN